MKKMLILIFLPMLLLLGTVQGQEAGILKKNILNILEGKKAKVGVSIADQTGKNIITIHGKDRFPLQSVFKFHVAAYILSKVDQQELSLEQKIQITSTDLLPNIYSPIKEKFPKGTVMSLKEILEYVVSKSDNIGCDVLLRLIGGPQAVESFFLKHKFSGISIKINEERQQASWDAQFMNWSYPVSATEVMSAFYLNGNQLLSEHSHSLLWQMMTDTETGPARIKGQLPKGTIVRHKTGTSGTNSVGITSAVNDVGLVVVTDRKFFFISIFVSDSKENMDTNEKIIADIAKVAWEFFEVHDTVQK
ncbi:class A beta-lactamase [Pedobacter lithocola]|uniref:Beta-lactamase n=1 Tax=Pedobacter lithocola TaxID=1908239 RepID=A0ABV8P762_9SPHI